MNPIAMRYVIAAWENPGPVPHFHYRKKAQLRREWPVLARALDMLIADADERTQADYLRWINENRAPQVSVEEYLERLRADTKRLRSVSTDTHSE